MMLQKPLYDALPRGAMLRGAAYSYEILTPLAQGINAITYLAAVKLHGSQGCASTEARVIVKELFVHGINTRCGTEVKVTGSSDTYRDYRNSFLAEVQHLSCLQHPNIVRIIESFEANHTLCFVTEYLNILTIDDMIARHTKLPERLALAITGQLCAAVSYMHSRGYLHGDVKPANAILKGKRVVLIDFGSTQKINAQSHFDASSAATYGTPGYSPQQPCLSADNYYSSPARDIYALGASLYKMLTGASPYTANDGRDVEYYVAELQRNRVSKPTIDVVERAMTHLEAIRYQTADEMRQSIKAVLTTTPQRATESSLIGYYKKKVGEPPYTPRTVVRVRVDNPLPMPDVGIAIKLWKNDRRGVSHEIFINKHVSSTVKSYLDGQVACENDLAGGIRDDVRRYLITHGFLSREHWEIEETTTPCAADFGQDVVVTLCYENGVQFVRRVKHAHPYFHNLLLEAVEGLLAHTSLSEFLPSWEELQNGVKPVALPTSDILDSPQYSKLSIFSLTPTGSLLAYHRRKIYVLNADDVKALQHGSECNLYPTAEASLGEYVKQYGNLISASRNIVTYSDVNDYLLAQSMFNRRLAKNASVELHRVVHLLAFALSVQGCKMPIVYDNVECSYRLDGLECQILRSKNYVEITGGQMVRSIRDAESAALLIFSAVSLLIPSTSSAELREVFPFSVSFQKCILVDDFAPLPCHMVKNFISKLTPNGLKQVDSLTLSVAERQVLIPVVRNFGCLPSKLSVNLRIGQDGLIVLQFYDKESGKSLSLGLRDLL